ncbi:MAG: FitA-like ribbon-helix-helix domain-containing protein [Pirellulaceae bacterium]
MGQLVISGLDPQVLSVLGVRAASHGRTVEAEARQILTEAIGTPSGSAWAGVDAIRERLAASNRSFGDSVELLREDRGR